MSNALRIALCSQRATITRLVKQHTVLPVRTAVFSPSGSFLPKPAKVPFGYIKCILVVVPFVYLGATISKNGAAFLEENDIFVPDDDDDD